MKRDKIGIVCVVSSKMKVVSEELGVLGIITPLAISSHGVMISLDYKINVHVCAVMMCVHFCGRSTVIKTS